MNHSIDSETQDVRVSCNAVDASDNCNAWSIDSIPPATQGGGTQVRARLEINPDTSNPTDEGDFCLTFHVTITNP